MLLTDEPLGKHLGENAAQNARRRFDLEQQVEAYLGWYKEILEAWRRGRSPCSL